MISTDSVINDNVGNNIPCVFKSSEDFKFFSGESSLNVDTMAIPDFALMLQTTAITVGTYNHTSGRPGVGMIKDGNELGDREYEIIIGTAGEIGDNIVGELMHGSRCEQYLSNN